MLHYKLATLSYEKSHKRFEPLQERHSVQTCTWLCVKAAMNFLTQILWTKKDISDRNKTSVLLCCKWVQKRWILYTSSNVRDCPPLFMADPALFFNDELVNKSKNWKRLSLRKLKFTLIFAPTPHPPWMNGCHDPHRLNKACANYRQPHWV